MKKLNNATIIFDVAGVLLEEIRPVTLAHGQTLTYAPIMQGAALVQKCYDQLDDNGNHRHRLFVLSNLKQDETLLKQMFPEIFNLFEAIVLARSTPYTKPDPRIFQHLLQTYALRPERTVFIDDTEINVRGAQQAGLTGIVCKDFDAVEKELNDLGIF
jgi:FMN phosphatase YigB (HAD superfamily)